MIHMHNAHWAGWLVGRLACCLRTIVATLHAVPMYFDNGRSIRRHLCVCERVFIIHINVRSVRCSMHVHWLFLRSVSPILRSIHRWFVRWKLSRDLPLEPVSILNSCFYAKQTYTKTHSFNVYLWRRGCKRWQTSIAVAAATAAVTATAQNYKCTFCFRAGWFDSSDLSALQHFHCRVHNFCFDVLVGIVVVVAVIVIIAAYFFLLLQLIMH